MNLSVIFILIFIAITAIGALATSITAGRRVKRERRQFRMAVFPRTTENPRYWILGIVPGILVSGGLILAHINVPPLLVLVLGVLSLLLALLPVYLPVLVGVIGIVVALVPAHVWQEVLGMRRPPLQMWGANFALLFGIIMIIAALGDWLLPYYESPHLFDRHGRTWVEYIVQQRVWLPLIVPMPYQLVSAIGWWPHVTVGGVSVALTIVPLFFGFGLHHRQPAADRVLRRDGFVLAIVGLGSLVLGVLGRTMALQSGMVVLMTGEISVFGMLICLMSRYQRPAIASAAGGVRVVAVLANTPAAKMQLRHGDTVLQCNGQDVPTNAALYAATQNLGTFCRLRVRGYDGQIRLAETAIFEGTPHMLGIITFPEAK